MGTPASPGETEAQPHMFFRFPDVCFSHFICGDISRIQNGTHDLTTGFPPQACDCIQEIKRLHLQWSWSLVPLPPAPGQPNVEGGGSTGPVA